MRGNGDAAGHHLGPDYYQGGEVFTAGPETEPEWLRGRRVLPCSVKAEGTWHRSVVLLKRGTQILEQIQKWDGPTPKVWVEKEAV